MRWSLALVLALVLGLAIWRSGVGGASPTAPQLPRARDDHALPEGPVAAPSAPILRESSSEVVAARPSDDDREEAPASTGDAFAAEYTGVRDPNMARLYEVFKASLEYQAKRMAASEGGAPDLLAQEVYLLHSAYIHLIQAQRHFSVGYGEAPPRPPNSADVEYHSGGMGGMHVAFELTRQEFPDLFACRDELRRLHPGLR